MWNVSKSNPLIFKEIYISLDFVIFLNAHHKTHKSQETKGKKLKSNCGLKKLKLMCGIWVYVLQVKIIINGWNLQVLYFKAARQ